MNNLGEYFLLKIVFLGDGAVGKTSLVYRYLEGIFRESYKMTIGVNFFTKLLEFGKETVKLQVWDFGGQERYEGLHAKYITGALGVMLPFDLTRRITFENLPGWIALVKENLDDKVPILLMGNKKDLVELREIDEEEAIKFAEDSHIISYIETSAKSGESVETAFEILSKESLRFYKKKRW